MATYRNQIRIEPVGFTEVTKALEAVAPDLRVAIKDTIIKAIPFAENEMVEQIVRRYNIAKADLMNQSSRHGRWRVKPKYPTESNLSGGIEVVGTRMPVMRFKVVPSEVPNQLGVRVADRPPITIRIVKRGRAQSGKPNVFLAKMRTGHIGVYKRKFPNPGGPRRMRPDGQPTQLPITEEYMLSVPEMMRGKKLRAKFDENLNKYVQSVFMEELKKLPPKAWRRVQKVFRDLI